MESQETAASRIERRKDEIIDLWKTEVLEKLPAAKYLSGETLVDSLPYFLDDLSTILTKDARGLHVGYRDLEEMARDHGRMRAEVREYSLDQLIAEYEILKTLLFVETSLETIQGNGETKIIILDSILRSITFATRGYTEALHHKHTEGERHWEKKLTHESMERKKLEATLDYLPAGVVILEKDSGQIVFFNRTARKLCGSEKLFEPTGYGESFYATDTQGELLDPQDLPQVRVQRGEKLKSFELNWHCNGKAVRLLFQSEILQPIGDGSSRILLVFQEASEATETIRSGHLIQESFAREITSDLRKPLAAAKFNAEALERAKPEHLTFRYTKKIIESVDQADDMIRDIIDANKMFSGEKLSFTAEHLELNEETSRVVSRLISIYGDRFIINSNKEYFGHWSVQALRRVIENLLLVSLKFGDRYAPILISMSDDGPQVVLSVHCTGAFIKEEDLGELWTDVKKWGIGLPLVKGLAEAQGGTVTVESAEGKGTTFNVVLPRTIPIQGQMKTDLPLSRQVL